MTARAVRYEQRNALLVERFGKYVDGGMTHRTAVDTLAAEVSPLVSRLVVQRVTSGWRREHAEQRL